MNATAFDRRLNLLAEVCSNLKDSQTAYKAYLDGGRIFKYAIQLRRYNDTIRQLLLEKKGLLSESLQKDASALIAHYDAWTDKWDDLQKQLQPKPEDEFIFANTVTFPREAAKNLEQEYLRLKSLA